MRFFAQFTVLLVLAVLVLSGSVGAALAQMTKPQFCEQYATRAVEAVTREHNNGCDLESRNPARYTSYYDDHYNWCMSAEHDVVVAEEDSRNYEYTTCQLCMGYAETAIEQFQKAFAICSAKPVSGPVWTVLPEVEHYNWCMFKVTLPGGGERYETHPDWEKVTNQRRSDLQSCEQ